MDSRDPKAAAAALFRTSIWVEEQRNLLAWSSLPYLQLALMGMEGQTGLLFPALASLQLT